MEVLTSSSIRLCTLALGVALALAVPASAGNVVIGAGSTLDLGTGSVDLGCSDLDLSGTLIAGSVGITGVRDVTIDPSGALNGGSATISLAGDWNNAGTFDAGTSTVQFVDGCALSSAVVSGSTGFANLSISSSTAKQVRFTAGTTQSVTGLLTLLGALGNRLELRSSVDGNAALLDVSGTSSADYVNVQDIDALAGNDILLSGNSTKGPNTPGWLSFIPVPMLAPVALGVLALLLLVSGQRWLSRSTRADPTP